MQHPSRSLAALLLAACAALGSAGALAQTAAAPAAGPAAVGGVQSANIFEVKPDASADPAYVAQTNAERAKVQPGNNAPMWRQVGVWCWPAFWSARPTS